ncbi:MAG: hypothetical protein ACJATI_005329 [Halioglobus sp.]
MSQRWELAENKGFGNEVFKPLEIEIRFREMKALDQIKKKVRFISTPLGSPDRDPRGIASIEEITGNKVISICHPTDTEKSIKQ